MHRILLIAVLLGCMAEPSCAVGEHPEPKWIQYGLICVNLDQVTKIEVQGNTLICIGRDKTIIVQDPDIRKDQLGRLRALLQQSPNWVEASKTRNENQEWYVNLSNVPLVGTYSLEGVRSAAFWWAPKDMIGVSSSNEATTKAWTYFSHRGFILDQAAQ